MSDDITRAIDWVGCTTNSPAHAHEIRMGALKALAGIRAELAAANALAEANIIRLRAERAEAAEAREIVLRELLRKIRSDYSAALMPEDIANIEALL